MTKEIVDEAVRLLREAQETRTPIAPLRERLLPVGDVATAYAVFGRRDFAAGLLADRPGPERAGPALRGSLGLAWRLQRGSVIGRV